MVNVDCKFKIKGTSLTVFDLVGKNLNTLDSDESLYYNAAINLSNYLQDTVYPNIKTNQAIIDDTQTNTADSLDQLLVTENIKNKGLMILGLTSLYYCY